MLKIIILLIQMEMYQEKDFIGWMAIGWTAFSLATGGFLTMIVRFLFPNVLFEPPQSFKIGFPDDFTIGEIDLRFKNKYAVWIGRNDEGIYALSTVCTHLGCTQIGWGLKESLNVHVMVAGLDSQEYILKVLLLDL